MASRTPPLPPEAEYESREVLLRSINAWAASHGCAFITGRSNKEASGRRRVFYACDRSGRLPDTTKVRQRQTTSKRTSCLYSVIARESKDGTWTLKHRPDPQYSVHNHDLSTDPLAHPAHRTVSASERAAISSYVDAGLAPKEIQSLLRNTHQTSATRQDIYNQIAEARRQSYQGLSPTHAFVTGL
jgi:hypothetical protein